MRALLDTHTFLWFIFGDAKLTSAARLIINSPNNHVLLSVVSLWEIAVKVKIGKLPLRRSFADLIRLDVNGNNIEVLPIDLVHLETLDALPLHHRDPFDRLIAAQALSENCPLIGADPAFDMYGVERMW